MDELQAGVELTFAVFPKPAVFLQPGKTALDNPALGHDRKGVQFTAFGDLHRDLLPENGAHTQCERLSGVATVAQDAFHPFQTRLATFQRRQCAFAIGDIRRRHGDGVREALSIDRDMTLDPRHLLARVITLLPCRVRVLHALRVHDQERAASVAPLFLAGRANLIF